VNCSRKVDWVGLGIVVGKQAVPFFVGLAAGLVNFDMVGLLKGVMAHWSDILIALLAIFLTPARIIGKVGELLARIPLVGKLLEWGLLHIKGFADGMGRAVLDALGFMGRAFLEGFRRVFPGVGVNFLTHLRNLPTYVGVVALEVAGKAAAMMRGLGEGDRGQHRRGRREDRRADRPDGPAVRQRRWLAGQARRATSSRVWSAAC
jgi:hypothetical protein